MDQQHPPERFQVLRDKAKQIYQWLVNTTHRFFEALLAYSPVSGWLRFIAILILVLLLFQGLQVAQVVFRSSLDFMRTDFVDYARQIWIVLIGEAEPPASPRAISLPEVSFYQRTLLLLTHKVIVDNLQRIVVAFTPVLVAFWMVAGFYEHLHRVGRLRTAARHLAQLYTPLPWRRFSIVDGHVVQPKNSVSLSRIGGPARLSLSPGNAAVLEPVHGPFHLIQPNQQNVPVEGFEYLVKVLDLNPQPVTLSLTVVTREGIRLKADGLSFQCSIYGVQPSMLVPLENNPKTLSRKNVSSETLSQAVIEKLTHQHWLGNHWEYGDLRKDDLKRFIDLELRKYVAQHSILHFLGSLEGLRTIPATGTQSSDPAHQFADLLTQHGKMVAVVWTGEGRWQVIGDVHLLDQLTGLETLYESFIMMQPAWFERTRRISRAQELRRLVNQPMIAIQKLINLQDPAQNLPGTVVAYRQAITQILNTNPGLPPELRREAQIVVSYLNRILMQRIS